MGNKANELTNQVIDFIYRQGGFSFRVSSVGIYDRARGVYRTAAKKGIADVLAVWKGRMLAIEVKIGSDRLSDEQTGFLANIKAAGGAACVAKDFDSFKEWFSTIVENHHSVL